MKKIIFLSLLTLIAACGTSKKQSEKHVVSEILWDEMERTEDTLLAPVDLTKRKVFHGAETIYSDLIHTKLDLRLDWNNSWLLGVATLKVKPHFYASDSLILDAKGMEIKSVKINNESLRYAYKADFLRIKLNREYTRSEEYEIVIDYIAKPDERTTSGSAAITSDKGLYFINPKGTDQGVMPQVWTQGETESSSVWFPTIDAPNVKTSQEILITVEDKYKTLSNGALLRSTKNNDGTRTDHWKQELPHAPYLFMLGVGEFKVVADSYTRPDGSKMDVNYYVEPEWEASAKAIFGETPKMIAFFSELTGVPYPWDKYHQIVVRDYVSGAMENTGAVIFGDYVYKTKRELLDENDQSTIAHELFHHWFGDLVTCESWSNLPLNESFANYSQYLWDEHRYGVDQADYFAENEKDGYYASSRSGSDHNLIWHTYDDKEEMFDAHSYNKGGRILHMLRAHLGDEAFFAGLKLYLRTNQFKAAEFHHLRLAFEEVSGQDLNWFFDQWFLGSHHPILDVEQYIDPAGKEVVLTVYQNQELATTPVYKLPVQVMVYDEAGEHLYPIVIEKIEQKFIFPVEGKLLNIIFDYQQAILGEIKVYKPTEQYIHQFYHGKRYLARKNALLEGVKGTPNAVSDKLVLDALNDPFWDIRMQAIDRSAYLTGQAAEDAKMKLLDLVQTDSSSHVRASALNYLALRLSPMEMEALCSEIIQRDQSYLVVGSALSELLKVNPKSAASVANSLEQEPSSQMKTTIAQIYAKTGDPKNKVFFEKLFHEGEVKGYDAILCLNAFTVFMSSQSIDNQQNALSLYKEHYDKGGLYAQMFMPQNLSYFISVLDQQQKDLQKKLSTLEKNNTAELVMTEKMLLQNKSLLEKTQAYLAELEAKKH